MDRTAIRENLEYMNERVPYWNAWLALELRQLSRIAEAIARATVATASTFSRPARRETPSHGAVATPG